jgi:uncharacterized membrane-anchored protein
MRLFALTALSVGLFASLGLAEPPTPAAADGNANAAAPAAPAEGTLGGVLAGEAGEAASEQDSEAAERAAFEAQLSYQTGDVSVGDDLATLHLGEKFRFIGPSDAEKVLVAWGNPPGSEALGMIFPAGGAATAEDSWAVVVTYSEEGHVEDDEAKDIDYADLLKDMKSDTEEANAEREKAGFGIVHLVGWAEAPHYDEKSKKLYWAKELDFGGPEHTLNYDIRALGRKGVLELNAVASMTQFALVKKEMPAVLGSVEFKQGMRYADFDPDMDTVAAFGIGALVAGKVAAKAGLFKLLIGGLLAGKKFIAAGLLALGALAKKLMGKKDEGESA